MNIRDIFFSEGLDDLFGMYDWLELSELSFLLDDPWDFAHAKELEGIGVTSAYLGQHKDRFIVLLDTKLRLEGQKSAGWIVCRVEDGLWMPADWFPVCGQALLKQLGLIS